MPGDSFKFRFPSNGKVYSKFEPTVSQDTVSSREFRFPSNGKVYSKLRVVKNYIYYVIYGVSIPFKRESV